MFGGRPTPAPTPVAVVVPSLVLEPAAPPPTVTANPLPSPSPSPGAEAWDWLNASDDTIRGMMDNFFCGTDPATGYNVAFFCDRNAEYGGYYYWISTPESLIATYNLGILEDYDDDSAVLVNKEGRETLRFLPAPPDAILFYLGDDQVFPNGVRLYQDSSNVDSVLRRLLATKRAVNRIH